MNRPLHYHLLGIGGIGISAFARLLRAQGHTVSGCDREASAQTADLQAEGVAVYTGHDPAHLSGVDVVVASEAVPREHPELLAARAAGLPVLPRMALLAELLRGRPSLGVIGSHGKTTTTAMAAVAFAGAGLDPAAFVGGNVREFDPAAPQGSNARLGGGVFVAEIDESDRRFAELACDTVVFTNAEDDHIGGDSPTYWQTVEEQHAGFARLVSRSRRVLYNADWPGLAELCAGAAQAHTYGLRGGDYRAEALQAGPDGTAFTVTLRGQELAAAFTPMPGEHNVSNALAALACVHLHGGDLHGAVQALAAFGGPLRRWQVLGEHRGARVVDDYAHNPTKVAGAVSAGRQTGLRVRAVMQPHRYLRTQQTWERLAEALMAADEVHLLDIAAAGEAPIPGVHSQNIAARMRELGHERVRYWPDRRELAAELRRSAAPGELILTLGAGDVWRLAHELAGAEVTA